MTTLAEAARMAEVTDRAKRTHQVRHVEADEVDPVADGVDLPDAAAFYVVRKRQAAGGDDGKKATPQWVVVHAATSQAAAVDWVAGDLPDEEEA